jgi:hypothetical protein
MSELADRVITAIAAAGGSAAFPEVLRHWLQRHQDTRQEQLQLDLLFCILPRLRDWRRVILRVRQKVYDKFEAEIGGNAAE